MEAYLLSWLSLLLRWAHIIAGIAWIGSSFYFMWLDARLNRPPCDPENDDIEGDIWSVHGGGFYHAQKYKVAPETLPEPLHWFKWEAYWTWMTGFALLCAVYYTNADAFLIDSEVLPLQTWQAVVISVAMLVVAWLIYHLLCTLPINDRWVAVIGALLILGLAWVTSQIFSGRGTYVQVGAMLGTIMAANVFFVIIPSQKGLVAAKEAGVVPDASLGLKAKRRSTHNNYLTLPVVFVMISPHYAMLYGHSWNWLLLFVVFAIGAVVRHFFNERNVGRQRLIYPTIAIAMIAALVVYLAPATPAGSATAEAPEIREVQQIVRDRCQACHSREPTHITAPVAAGGVELDNQADIRKWALRIEERTVTTNTMPLGNLTAMTEEERETLRQWFAAGSP